eukprot:6226201-Pyramimonas_sp.AAC.1
MCIRDRQEVGEENALDHLRPERCLNRCPVSYVFGALVSTCRWHAWWFKVRYKFAKMLARCW